MTIYFYSKDENKTVTYESNTKKAIRDKKTWEADTTNLTHYFPNHETAINELTKKGYKIKSDFL